MQPPSTYRTLRVPHLGTIHAAYQTPPKAFDTSKPTLVLINSFATSSSLFTPQFEDADLVKAVNLIAIDALGHGRTTCKAKHWTYWDSAVMNFQVLGALGIRGKVFVAGVGQGGWVAARMALLSPEKIAGIIPISTTLDSENERLRGLGCWNAHAELTPLISSLSSMTPTPDSIPPEDFFEAQTTRELGPSATDSEKAHYLNQITSSYTGEAGLLRLRMAAITLRDRDSLLGRLSDITCPVLWLQGDKDEVYSVANAREEAKLLTGSKDVEVKVLEGGGHLLNVTNAEEVGREIRGFVRRYGNLAELLRVAGIFG